MLFACEKIENNIIETESFTLQPRFSSQHDTLMVDISTFHNQGLDSTLSIVHSFSTTEIIDAVEFFNVYYNYPSDYTFICNMLEIMGSSETYEQQWKNTLLSWNIDSVKKSQVLAIWNCISTNYSHMDSLGLALDNLKREISDAEVYGGITIAEASLEYWKEVETDTTNIIVYLHADAFGYLMTWGRAWLNDQGDNYSNSWEDQKRRITEGAWGALAFSTGVRWR